MGQDLVVVGGYCCTEGVMSQTNILTTIVLTAKLYLDSSLISRIYILFSHLFFIERLMRFNF